MDSETIAQSGYNWDFNISIHVINSLTQRARSWGLVARFFTNVATTKILMNSHTILCIVILLVLKPKTKMLLLFKYT